MRGTGARSGPAKVAYPLKLGVTGDCGTVRAVVGAHVTLVVPRSTVKLCDAGGAAL